jgi:hypothetical protein
MVLAATGLLVVLVQVECSHQHNLLRQELRTRSLSVLAEHPTQAVPTVCLVLLLPQVAVVVVEQMLLLTVVRVVVLKQHHQPTR